jgi:hypothetical protein
MSIARRGNRLAYSYGFADTNIWRVDASKALQSEAAEVLISSTRAETSPQYSPDGTRIVRVVLIVEPLQPTSLCTATSGLLCTRLSASGARPLPHILNV